MTSDLELAAQIREVMEKSRSTLRAARELHAIGPYNDAASRTYYSVFHAMQAALLTKKLSFSKHSAVLAAFNQHFIRTGTVAEVPFSMLKRLFRDRQDGDYHYGWDIGCEKSAANIADAERAISAIAGLIEGPRTERREG